MTIAILAGGASRRMGQDKAALRRGDRTWLEHLAGEALACGLPLLVVGRAVPPDWPYREVRFVPDDEPGAGPLAGLATALRAAQDDVLLLACDLPLLTHEAIGWLLEQRPLAGRDGLVTTLDSQLEPLFSIYREAGLSRITVALSAGQRAMHKLIEAGEFAVVELPERLVGQLRNVNTPEELGQV